MIPSRESTSPNFVTSTPKLTLWNVETQILEIERSAGQQLEEIALLGAVGKKENLERSTYDGSVFWSVYLKQLRLLRLPIGRATRIKPQH